MLTLVQNHTVPALFPGSSFEFVFTVIRDREPSYFAVVTVDPTLLVNDPNRNDNTKTLQ